MKRSPEYLLRPALAMALGLLLAPLLTSCGKPATTTASVDAATSTTSTNRGSTTSTNAAGMPGTNAAAGANGTNGVASAGAMTNAAVTVPPGAPGIPPTGVAGALPAGVPGGGGFPGIPGGPSPVPPMAMPGSTNEIQVAFQGANVEMIVQWLAQNTGKTVIKHPRVQCQLTIVSSKKVSPREAVDLVFRALTLEGFNAIETRSSIFLVPEGQDVKMNPEIFNAAQPDLPEGRQRIMKIFPLVHAPASEMRDRIRGVLSEKATVEADDRASRLIITDYTDNLRLAAELLKELDVTTIGDSVVEILPLKFSEAEEIGNLIGLILNAQSGGASSASPRASSSAPAGGPPGMSMIPGMPGGGPSPMSGAGAGGGGSSGNPMQIRIWPDQGANRLIVSCPKSRLEDVRKLVALLDTDKPGDMTVRVLPLKNVQASDLVKEVQPLYQKLNTKSPKEAVEIAANDRSNSLIILSSASNFKRVSDFVASIDTTEAMEKVTRTFTLKNADAQDVAKQLQSLGQDSDSSSRYRYFYFGDDGGGRKGSKKPSFVADRRRNAVVVQAPPAQMDEIARMITELDEPVGEESPTPKIYPLKFVSAVDIEEVLNELFLKKQERRSYFYYDDFDSGSNQTPDRDVGRLYGKVRITSEPYSNLLIITANSKENLAAVEGIVKQLDVPSQAGETTVRVPLRFAKASTLANGLNILFAKNGSPPVRQVPQQPQPNANPQQPAQPDVTGSAQASFELSLDPREDGYYPWIGGNADSPRNSDGRSATRQVSDIVGRVRVVSDERGNGLLVSANVHLLPQILKLIEEMDAPTPQVLIEARILEVETDKLDKIGVRWSPQGNQVFSGDDYDNSILGTTKGRYTTGFGGRSEVTGPATGELGSAINAIRSGVLDSTVNLDLLVQFLRKNTDATVLAEPQINIADNEMGRLFVGQQVPFIDKSQTTDQGGLNQSFKYKLVGVILEVTPHINKSGEVSLRIRAESSSIQPNQVVSGGPVVDTRNFRTDVTAKNGDILVLGGIIQKQFADTIRKVPFLGDIPGLGWAFKKKDKVARNVELMVFLRPRITRTPEDVKALLDELDTKAPLIAPWKHGGRPSGESPSPKSKE